MYKLQISVGFCRGRRGENWAGTAGSLTLAFPLSASVAIRALGEGKVVFKGRGLETAG